MPPLAALLLWPVICQIFFQSMRVPLAITVSIIGGYLLLPTKVSIDFPMLPELNKYSIPALTALVLALVFANRRFDSKPLKGLLPNSWLMRVLLLCLVTGIMGTVLTNSEPLVYGSRFLSGMSTYDGLSEILGLMMALIPLLLARKFLAHPNEHRTLLWVLCLAALGYSFLVLFEARMSPQLNSWIYGFFPHSWRQHYRSGDWRPIVFLQHGLLVGLFLAMATLAAAGLFRVVQRQQKGLCLLLCGWLLLTLIVSKNLGALLITFVLLPVLLMFSARLQLLIAALIAAIFLTYPLLRGADLVPIDRITGAISVISEERAASLNTRLKNEELLLDKAAVKPWFGWGQWGRSRVFDDQGRDLVLTDGYWVITIGVGGWIGYMTEMGLLTFPILLLWLYRKRYQISLETSVCALLLAANLVDLIPNAGKTPLTWLLAGALWGRLELGQLASKKTEIKEKPHIRPNRFKTTGDEETDTPRAKPAYTRQQRRIERANRLSG